MSFIGGWEIVSSPDFDDAYLNEEVQPYLKLKQVGKRVTGNYQAGIRSSPLRSRR